MITINITEETNTVNDMIYCLEEIIRRLTNGVRLSYDPNFTIEGDEEQDEDEDKPASTKMFMWKDKSGHGGTNNALPLSQLLEWDNENAPESEDDEDESLHTWARNAGEGDEWHGRADYLICTHS